MFPISTFNAEVGQARLRVKPGNDTPGWVLHLYDLKGV
jgi:hypothetical protein